MKFLSIVVPSSGHLPHVRALLDSVRKYLADYVLDVVVVCNPSHLKMNELMNIYSDINLKVLQTDIIGVNHARQMGLDQTQYNHVLFLDDDCRFTAQEQLSVMYNEILKHPELFAVGGYYHTDQIELNSVAKAYAQNQMNWLKLGRVDAEQHLSAYLIGGFFILNKEVALRENLVFDSRMIFGGTEKDFFLRAYFKGLQLRLLNVSIQHDYQDVQWAYFRKVYKQGRGQRYIDDKGLKFEPKYLDFNKKNIWLTLFDLVFWAGYYLSKSEYGHYLRYLLNLCFDSLNEKKLVLLNKLKKHL